MQAFNDSLKQVAEVHLLKVDSDDEYYHNSQLMLDKLRQSKVTTIAPQKDTVIIKHETTINKGREKPEEKVTAQTDAELTKKYVAQSENLINKFESLYQSGYTATVESKKNYVSNMQSVLGQLNG